MCQSLCVSELCFSAIYSTIGKKTLMHMALNLSYKRRKKLMISIVHTDLLLYGRLRVA